MRNIFKSRAHRIDLTKFGNELENEEVGGDSESGQAEFEMLVGHSGEDIPQSSGH